MFSSLLSKYYLGWKDIQPVRPLIPCKNCGASAKMIHEIVTNKEGTKLYGEQVLIYCSGSCDIISTMVTTPSDTIIPLEEKNDFAVQQWNGEISEEKITVRKKRYQFRISYPDIVAKSMKKTVLRGGKFNGDFVQDRGQKHITKFEFSENEETCRKKITVHLYVSSDNPSVEYGRIHDYKTTFNYIIDKILLIEDQKDHTLEELAKMCIAEYEYR